MFGNPIFGVALAQAIASAHAQRVQDEQPREYAAADQSVIDVEARVIEDMPVLPAPTNEDKP
jgi:hypothetical protein